MSVDVSAYDKVINDGCSWPEEIRPPWLSCEPDNALLAKQEGETK